MIFSLIIPITDYHVSLEKSWINYSFLTDRVFRIIVLCLSI